MNDHRLPARGLTALLLAIGIATPVACAKGLTGTELFRGDGGAGGSGGSGGDVSSVQGSGPSTAQSTSTVGEGPSSSASSTSASSTVSVAAGTTVGVSSGSSGTGGMSGSCCSANGTPSCNDAPVAQCVCAVDSYCCSVEWDSTCVSEVDSEACGNCGSSVVAASSSGSGGGGDCCVASSFPGCNDASAEQCVCSTDDYCCQVEWDSTCVGEVDSLGCGVCGGSVVAASSTGSGGGGDCCQEGSGPGCTDSAIEACVCADDDFCCTDFWDSYCVDEVDYLGCGTCF